VVWFLHTIEWSGVIYIGIFNKNSLEFWFEPQTISPCSCSSTPWIACATRSSELRAEGACLFAFSSLGSVRDHREILDASLKVCNCNCRALVQFGVQSPTATGVHLQDAAGTPRPVERSTLCYYKPGFDLICSTAKVLSGGVDWFSCTTVILRHPAKRRGWTLPYQ